MRRRSFTREFKLEAVKLVTERGMNASQAARDLGIAPNIVGRWVREAGSDKKQAFPGRGQMKADDVLRQRPKFLCCDPLKVRAWRQKGDRRFRIVVST